MTATPSASTKPSRMPVKAERSAGGPPASSSAVGRMGSSTGEHFSINTGLQPGELTTLKSANRFNGFPHSRQLAKFASSLPFVIAPLPTLSSNTPPPPD
jgi:hypothetical protein